PDPGIAAAALGASESGTLPGTAPAQALHTFTLDSGSSRCFFHDSTTLTPLSAPVPVRLADPSGGPVVAHSSTFLPCPAVPSGSLSRLHLPLSLPPLPPSPAPPCLPCVEGRQRATPQSSSYPPMTAPLQNLHMDVWGPPRVSGQGCKRYFLLVVDDYTRYTTVFLLCSNGQVVDVLIPWIRTVRLQLRERFSTDLPVLRLHSDRGEFSSDLLRDFCHGEGILQSFTLPDSPQKNGIAERHIGYVMEVARTSMIHAVAPHFLWPFAVGDASVFRVWGSRVFVRDTSTDKLSARAIPCVFLGFVPDAPGWQFYHPTSRRVLPSQDVTFDESVPFYRLFPYRSAPLPPPPHFLAPGPSAVDSGSVRGIASGGAELRGAESGDVHPTILTWLVRRARLWIGATRAGGAGAAGVGGAGVPPVAGVPEGTAATGPGGSRTWGSIAAGTGGVGGAGTGDPTKFGAAGAGGSGTNDTGAGGAGVGGIGTRGARAGVAGAGGAGAVNPGGTVRPRPYYVPLLQQVLGVPSSPDLTPPLLCPPPDESQLPLQPASPLPTPSPYTEQCGGLKEHREPVSRQFSPVCTAPRDPRSRPTPVPGTHAMALRPSSVPLRVPLPAPRESSLPEVPDPESNRARAASPTVSCLLATAVTDPSFGSAIASALVAELLDFPAACRLDYTTALVAESASACPPSVGDPDAPDIPTPRSYAEAITGTFSSHWQAAKDAEMASWKSTGTYVDEVPPPGANIVDGMWIFRVKRQLGSPPTFKARYVARGFSQRQRVDYFHTFSPTPLTTLRLLLHVAAQRDYELHSLDFSTAFQQGSLHKEIWLLRPPGFTGSFPAGT
ncbi:unnamed protein product, partial [Closterium sp. NIES-54]